MKIINVILSGGVGSRLWPLSRKSKPKQYLPIFQGETLFQNTVKRNKSFCDQIIVVGNINNYLLSRKDLQKVGEIDFVEIIEACPRNTAAAIAFAAFSANPSDILIVTPSDHLIASGNSYSANINRGIALAKEGSIVTFGLKPTKPETGYGYIEAEGEEVKSFREKPDKEKANSFIQKGNFYWNSGIFCFRASVFLEELELLHPRVFSTAKLAFANRKSGFIDNDLSLEIPSISVDYAVMEKTKKIKVVPSNFEWSDMGSFESFYDYFLEIGHKTDEDGNMVIGTDLHTEFMGLEDTIFVYTEDAILILKKDHAQKVKEVFERLENETPDLVE